jgi:hypothetical protein
MGGNITNDSVATLQNFANAVNALPTSAVNISVKASVDVASINTATTLLTKVANSGLFKDYNASVTVTYKKESSEVDGYDPKPHERIVTYKKDSSEVDGYNPPNLTRTVTYHIVTTGGAGDSGGGGIVKPGANGNNGSGLARIPMVDGTAHANGTVHTGKAFKSGDWRTKDSGVALMGEEGRK